MTKATSQNGVEYNYKYNEKGQSTELTANSSDKKFVLKSNLAYTKNGRFLDKLFTINNIIKAESKNAKIMENTYRFDY